MESFDNTSRNDGRLVETWYNFDNNALHNDKRWEIEYTNHGLVKGADQKSRSGSSVIEVIGKCLHKPQNCSQGPYTIKARYRIA